MQERSSKRQAFIALLISSVVLGTVLISVWFLDKAADVLRGSNPPLPSGVPPTNAYLLTLAIGVLGMVAAGVTLMGVGQGKYFTRRFAWVIYVLVGLPFLAILAAPLQRGGHEAFMSLPGWLLAPSGRGVIAASMGALVLGSIDLRRVMPGLVLESSRVTRRSRSPAIRGLPGRFTAQAWRALSYMQEEAQRFEHGYMGTEHLLLGLLRDNRSQATRVLVNLGAEPSNIKTQLESVIGRRGSLYTGSSGITKRCQHVIETASRVARSAGHRTVGTGHLLQSLLDQPDDVAGQTLDGAGVTTDRIEAELKHIGPETD